MVQTPYSSSDAAESHTSAIQRAISKHSVLFPNHLPSPTHPPVAGVASQSFTVLLTGSTGNLGTNILAYLLGDPTVDRIFAHNRPSASNVPSVERQKASFTEHGIDHAILESDRVGFLEGDLQAARLGLTQHVYDQLLCTVNVVIHSAWKSNFKLTLDDYEPFMIGSRNLIHFARAATKLSELRFIFVSTYGSVGSWPHGGELVPETSFSDASIAVSSGYGESKYVVERVLQQCPFRSSTSRVAQLSGSRKTGCWPSNEWIPGVIRTSVTLGMFPSSEALVSWVSLCDAAKIILDDALHVNFLAGPAVCNLEHPQPIQWNSIIAYVNKALVQYGVVPTAFPLVSVTQWTAKLEEVGARADTQMLKKLPALKVLPIFDWVFGSTREKNPRLGDLPALETNKLMNRSETMAAMKPLEAEDAARWVKYWISIGFLPGPTKGPERHRASL